ncbi:MAG: TonB-dependent receptor [FCB group bacterium]|nr:TonB-dependent receptor [FCB group bacterium]MBL7029203.1 TonB-dependent receptor [Candidatus Neomarinimicrobiota bacterium]MBL7120507.1 TonB-dependent receptor [Candidatus Neomarinimicrobiota bacterium]
MSILSVAGFGQSTGSVQGRVTDAKTGEGLPGVNIHIQGSSFGTTSNLDGYYQLSGLSPGEYTLSFSMMGYAPYNEKNIGVVLDVPVQLSVQLKLNVLASPQVVVTSSRKEQDILQSPFSVSAIGPREIQAKAVVSMIDILSYESGVSTIKGQLNIRGTSGYTMGAGTRSLLLLDGIPMLGSAAGNVTWATIPTSEVDRVEIVKSGGSALYGSSAMGGVVNIITRNAPLKPETRISTKIGVYSHPRIDEWRWRESRGLLYNTEISHSRSIGNHAAWIRVQKRSDDGFMELNWEEAVNISAKLKLNFGSAHSAAFFVNILDDKAGLTSIWKSSANPFEAPEGSSKDGTQGTKIVLNGHYNYVYSPDLAIKTKTSAYWNEWTNFGADPNYSNENRFYEEVQASKSWTSSLTSIFGLTLQQNNVSAQIFGDHNSSSFATFLLMEKRLRQFTLSAGSRWETYQVDGKSQDEVFTPQLALNWKPTPWLGLRISTGKGFRVPTVAEMFTSARRSIFTVEPNPDLISETSINREFGLTLLAGQMGVLDLIKLDAAIFHNKFENFIEPVPNSDAVIHFTNIADARIMGLELGLGLSAFNNLIDYKSAFTILDPMETDAEGEILDTLSYRHRYHWISSMGIHYWGMDASIEYRYLSRMESVELFQENDLTGADARVPIHIMNVGIGSSYHDWHFLMRVENVFQYYYTQLERNIEEERIATFTIERRF